MVDDKTLFRNSGPDWSLKNITVNVDDPAIAINGEITVGRTSDNDLLISDGSVSRLHATLRIENSRLTVIDNNSANGTYVNGKRIDTADLCNGDIVSFDIIQFEVIALNLPKSNAEDLTLVRRSDRPLVDPAPRPNAGEEKNKVGGISDATEPVNQNTGKTQISMPDKDKELKTQARQAAEVTESGTLVMESVSESLNDKDEAKNDYLLGLTQPVMNRQFLLNKSRMTIGRSPLNDLIIKAESVSSHHAEIERTEEGWVLRDIASSNGTEVNGIVGDNFTLLPGDKVVLGEVSLELRSLRQSTTAIANIPAMKSSPLVRPVLNRARLIILLSTIVIIALVTMVWFTSPSA